MDISDHADNRDRKSQHHPSSKNKSRQQQHQLPFWSSMRRHLPKSTIHTHLDAMAQWSRFKTAKKFEAVGSIRDADSNKRTFRVQVPMRLLVWTCGIFLVIPLTIFGWKELHLTALSRNNQHHPHVRSSSHNKEDSSHWMEDHLYLKTNANANSNTANGTGISSATTGDQESSPLLNAADLAEVHTKILQLLNSTERDGQKEEKGERNDSASVSGGESEVVGVAAAAAAAAGIPGGGGDPSQELSAPAPIDTLFSVAEVQDGGQQGAGSLQELQQDQGGEGRGGGDASQEEGA